MELPNAMVRAIEAVIRQELAESISLIAAPQTYPEIFREPEAAKYLGCSPRYLRKLRFEDAQRLALDEPMVGPHWITQGAKIGYTRADLGEYISRRRSRTLSDIRAVRRDEGEAA